MIQIKLDTIVGKQFTIPIGNDDWICVGIAGHPAQSSYFVLGMTWDQASNRTRLASFPLKDVSFMGQLTA